MARHRPPEKQGKIPKPLVAYKEEEINEQFGEGQHAYYRIFPEGFWNGKNLWEVTKGTVLYGRMFLQDQMEGRPRKWNTSQA